MVRVAKRWRKQARLRREEARSGREQAGCGKAASETAMEGTGGAVKEELVEQLRRLAQWKNNDVVKLAFLEAGDTGEVEKLDLTGVVELKRNPNGTFEATFVDKGRVLAMLRELLEQREDGRLEEFMDALRPGDGDEA